MIYRDRIVKRRMEEDTIFFSTVRNKKSSTGVNFTSY